MQDGDFVGLHNLKAIRGAEKKAKRLGRGESSGLGKTSGRGHKGQKSRKSGNVRPGFEGGQNPLARRLPKKGFDNSKFSVRTEAVNLSRLVHLFDGDMVLDPEKMLAMGLVKKRSSKVKILSMGDVDKPLKLRVHAVSKEAKEKIVKAGGEIELIGN